MAQHDFAPAWLSFPTPPPSTAKLPPAPERPGDHVSRPDGRAGSSRRRHNSSDAFLDAGFGRNPDVRTRPISRQNSLETEPVRGTGNHGNRRPPGRLHSDTGASRGSYHWEGGGGQRGGPYHDGDGRGGGGGGGGGGGAHRGSYHADGGGGGGGQRGGPYHPDSDAPPRRGYRDRDRDGGHRSRNGAFHGGGHKGRRGGGMEDGGPGGGMEDGARRGDDKADEKQFEVEDFPSLNPDADRDPGQGKPASVPAGVWENPPNPRPRSTKMLVIKKSCREESFSAAFASTLAPPCAGASAITPLQLCSPSSSSSSSSSASSGAGAARAAHHHQHHQHQHHPASAHNGVAAVAPVSGGAAAPVVAVVPGGGVGGGGGGSGAVVGPGVGAALPPAIIGVAAGVSGGGAVGVGKPGSGGAGGGAAGVGSSSIYKILVPKPAALPAKPSLWKSPGNAKDARSSGSFTRDSAFRLYSPFSPKPAPPPPVPVPSVVSVAPAHNHHKESAAVATPATVASAAPPVTAATAPASPGSAAVAPSATVVSAVVAASALRPASTSPVEAGGSAAMAPRLTKLGRARNNGKSEFLKTLKREARNGEPAGRPHGSGTGGGANTNAGHGQQDENRRGSSGGGSSSSSNNGGGNGGNNNNGGMRLEEAESPVGSGGPMASDWPEHQGQRSPEASSPSPDDHMLSSSLEAEHRLLREMGWTELCEQDEAYEPLTEDEMKEFQRISEKLQSNGLRRNGLLKHAPATTSSTSSSSSSSFSSSSSSSFSSTATVTKVAAATPGSAAAPSPGFRFPSWGAALLGQPELLAVAHGDAHLLHDDGDDDSTSTSDTSDDDDL